MVALILSKLACDDSGDVDPTRSRTIPTDGLAAPQTVAGLSIERSTPLTGLTARTDAGFSLGIADVPASTSPAGLENLQTVGVSGLCFRDTEIVDLDAPSGRTTVEGDVELRSNTALCQDEVGRWWATVDAFADGSLQIGDAPC